MYADNLQLFFIVFLWQLLVSNKAISNLIYFSKVFDNSFYFLQEKLHQIKVLLKVLLELNSKLEINIWRIYISIIHRN